MNCQKRKGTLEFNYWIDNYLFANLTIAALKKGEKYEELFKQVHINIPFLNVVQQMPCYAKFLKDLVTAKRKTNVFDRAFLIKTGIWTLVVQRPCFYPIPKLDVISVTQKPLWLKGLNMELDYKSHRITYSAFECDNWWQDYISLCWTNPTKHGIYIWICY